MAKLKINGYDGPSDGAELEGFYFEPCGDGGYNLYAPVKLNTEPITHEHRTVTFYIPNAHGEHGPQFTVTVTSFPNMTLGGTWHDGTTESIRDVPGTGTFQAQAGGTGTFAEVAAAAAKAK